MFDTTAPTTDMTDAEIKIALANAQAEAPRLYLLALAAPSAPTNGLRAAWPWFASAMVTPATLMLPAREARGLYDHALTAARAAVKFYGDFLRDHATKTPAQWERDWTRDLENAQRAANPPPPVGHMPTPPAFDARAALIALATRGVTLAATADGSLAVSGPINDTDRAAIRAHKAVLIEALSKAEVI